jgi:hypothetical protein
LLGSEARAAPYRSSYQDTEEMRQSRSAFGDYHVTFQDYGGNARYLGFSNDALQPNPDVHWRICCLASL